MGARSLNLIKLYRKYDRQLLTILSSLKGKEMEDRNIESIITRVGNEMMQTVPALSGLYMSRVSINGERKYVVVDYVNEKDFMHLEFNETTKSIRVTDKTKRGVKVRKIGKSGVKTNEVGRLPNGVRDEVEYIVRKYKEEGVSIEG